MRACAVPDRPVAISRCETASIYVADFNHAVVEEILSRYFEGFTILPARGCWHKTCESSLIVQIAGASEVELRKGCGRIARGGQPGAGHRRASAEDRKYGRAAAMIGGSASV